MNPYKFSAIAHRDHDYCNPISAAQDRAPARPAAARRDARACSTSGCGRAELALRIIERFGSTVVAVDRSSLMLDQARERAEWTGALGKLHLDDIDIRDFRADPETFHLSGDARRRRHRRRHGGHLQPAEGVDAIAAATS